MSLSSHGSTALAAETLSPSLLEVYDMFFEVVPATTPDLLEEAHRLRYQVYCIENEFEPKAENPGGLEMDEFDARSCQSLLLHRATGAVAGTVRLILPGTRESDTLPAFDVSRDLDTLEPECLPRSSTAEISRFAISKEFRRRIEDGRWPAVREEWRDKVPPETNRRVLPHLTLGLMRALVKMSTDNGVSHWCANVETPLLRLLKRLGIHFHAVGPLVNYHGWRQPVYSSIAELSQTVYRSRPEVWDVITDRGNLVPVPEIDDFRAVG